MKKYLILFCTGMISSISSFAQQDSILVTNTVASEIKPTRPEHVYKIKPWIDIPATLAMDAWSLYGMSIIYGRDKVPVGELELLDKKNINSFDRPIADNYSESAKKTSDMFFYGSMPLPLLLLIDKKIRKDGLRVGLLFLETMGATGTIYTISAMSANRFRPYAYNKNVPLETRQRGGARNSFFAGHPAVVASSTFFMAKIWCDYHPNMKHKWILYTLAGAATATTGYLRLKAGQHFKTDVITGIIIGPLVGVMIPHLHKNKSAVMSKLSLLPNMQLNGGGGFTALYKLGK